ncbi:MAG TPA: glycosyltransferase [Ktedonobacteraceae bacterium]|nr:glycosyltransferase [Ktedonobacteraceae bacterium]
MNGQERTILFLIADTGAGHRSAANAIRNAITIIAQRERQARLAHRQEGNERGSGETDTPGASTASSLPPYRVEIVDVFEEYSRFPLREAMKLYGPAIRYNPRLYGQVFHLSNQAQSISAVQTMATPLIHKGLLRLISTVQPDVIVSIHPLLNHVTLRALQDLAFHIPFITVVTDLVSLHYSWFAPGADAYIVPTERARQIYVERGLDPRRVHMLGMPIDPRFTLLTESKQELQRKLGLEPGIPVVLLVGGGDGAGGLRSSVQAISQAHLPVQLLIVAGRNTRLYMHLQRIRSSLRVPAKIFGFVHNMPEMMRASDVIITKAGPGTICEALACELPIILSAYVPGQEEGNVTFVTENQVGELAYDLVEMVNVLRLLIKPGSQLMRQQLENARRIARPNASFDIARCILGFLPSEGTPGVWQEASQQRTQRERQMKRLQPVVPVRIIHTRLPRLRSNIAMGSIRRRLTRLKFIQRTLYRHREL